jgi:hypothetical protein
MASALAVDSEKERSNVLSLSEEVNRKELAQALYRLITLALTGSLRAIAFTTAEVRDDRLVHCSGWSGAVDEHVFAMTGAIDVLGDDFKNAFIAQRRKR